MRAASAGSSVALWIVMMCGPWSCAAQSRPAQTQPVAAEPASISPATTQPASKADPAAPAIETIVFFRHGEKPADGLGQISPKGFNRALAISSELPRRFGRPDYLFAPDPQEQVSDRAGVYYYLRPLATIEPTAIRLGLCVHTPFGYTHINELTEELTRSKYAHATIFVAWEHAYARLAVVRILQQFHADADHVPEWPSADFDSVYVLKLTRPPNQAATATFTHDQENLDNQSDAMPTPAN